ncbi:XrtA/PEP-CTERM system amidotransferase [Permianibacter aggregans]|uniref:asparagine synthase (glutamine-hydrolyzing) n=1 Tax=Permianibacter aggregans TaxID=1510150 RepID=A0A4R6US91_9GAMM|nr:XrtA/PEP-CTERM system amidotransferase [Permianibacter aggregans]QGX40072.1 amidotransferase 1, exosortase A system-associated [Permianibacter aggregans]TDQ49116.1 asparagine synthase (glutamine-hydrolysing) [Permianibacter aggregans]
MCGISGIFTLHNKKPIDESLLKKITDIIAHRGPDESGLFRADGVGLGHRRLSIIDLASGQQPMLSEDKKIALVFNGEIYNFVALRDELANLGHRFLTHSDTEVLLHAWIEWQEKCVERLRGMFAFAIYDQRRDGVFLARDHLGKKPLYYAELDNDDFVFGSELKVLTAHPRLQRIMDAQAIEEYFAYGYVPEPKSIYKNVYKLPPASAMWVSRAGIESIRTFWDVSFQARPALDQKQAEQELVERLREAVKIRLMSEVPLGAFLSGGVDSSSVVAMMAGLSDKPVNTCAISFGDPAFNETVYAQQIADRYKTNHFVREVDPNDFSLIDKLAEVYDEPYADSSALPTYRVCQLARERVTVVLSGDGGDENLAGYRRYLWHMREERMRQTLPLGLRKAIFGTLGKVYPKLDFAPRFLRAKATFQGLARESVEAYFHAVSIFKDDMRPQLASNELRKLLAGYHAGEVMQRHAAKAPTEHPMSLVQYLDFKTYLVGDILTKVDRASMAHALEVRVPFLDADFVDWMSGLPPEWKLNGSDGKHLLKSAMKSYLPHDLMYRKKMGFAVPLANWFRGPLRQTLEQELTAGELHELGLFNPRYIRHLLEQHFSGVRDYSAPLWTLSMFARFLRYAKPTGVAA